MSKLFTVKMPDIGEGVVEGEVIEWLKKVDESVKQNEPVVVVMTDKATVELSAPYAGKIAKHYYQAGQTAIRDKGLYDIEVADETKVPISVEEGPYGTHDQIKNPSKVHSGIIQPAKVKRETETALAIPRVRKLAEELGVDLEQVQGTGREGSVTEEDLKRFIAEQKGSGPEGTTALLNLAGDEAMPLVGVRHFMIKKMKEANDNIPHFSYFEQADATRLIQLREKIKEQAAQESIHLTFMPFFIRALSQTIRHFPMINSSLDVKNAKLLIHQQHNIGIAIATDNGLIVPVLKNVQDLTFAELIKSYNSLKTRALEKKLQPQDMKESTITISNFGVLGGGGLWATPIINFPEVAILAVARIQKQPIVKNNEVAIRDVLDLSWSFDHRVIDGDLAASVSHHFSLLIQNPAPLL